MLPWLTTKHVHRACQLRTKAAASQLTMHVCEASQQQAIARHNTPRGICCQACLLQAPLRLQRPAIMLQPLYNIQQGPVNGS